MQDNGRTGAGRARVLAAMLETTGPDIVDTVGMDDGCILNPERFRTIGLGKYTEVSFRQQPMWPVIPCLSPCRLARWKMSTRASLPHYGVCAGCHAYSSRMIGPHPDNPGPVYG